LLFPFFLFYSILLQLIGLQAVCVIRLTKVLHHQLLKLHIEDPGVGTEAAKPSLELAPPPRTSGLSPVDGWCGRSL
jgi:hypothetical protein